MTEEAHGGRHKRTRIWLALSAVVTLLAVLIVPPLVSINRYKGRITHLMSVSLGRPVRLSSVELRLLPRPGFLLTDLTVEEDPSFGAEPVLHASTVTAAIRLLPLWRGRLEISRISVDEASLNLVRTTAGRWNLDPFFRTAAAQSQPGGAKQGKLPSLPYLEATNSRINIKQGFEKLPFSLVNADLSFWQDEPGDWRVRLRGQPARTDVSLDLADTGILQLEARMRHAPLLRQMPVHLDLEWSEAQLGQLSRLVLGADPGWRGDLTGEMHLDGTAESAQIATRLRATGVHRAEFAPAAPLDFDANCHFIYHYSDRNFGNLVCDSPLGDGRLRLEGNLPSGGAPKLSVELQRIPAQAGLDALRTVRSGLDAGLEAKGTVSGKLTYDPSAQNELLKNPPLATANRHSSKTQIAKGRAPVLGPLTGSLIVEGFRLSGDSLGQPIQIQKITLEPLPEDLVQAPGAGEKQPEPRSETLVAAVSIPSGAIAPLAVSLRIALSGYQLTVHGPASVARLRELARAAALPNAAALDAMTGDPVTLDLSADGPWLSAPEAPSTSTAALGPPSNAASTVPGPNAAPDRLVGTLTFHDATWKSGYMANPVEISQGTLHFDAKELRWDPVVFSYGPLKGTASLLVPAPCEAPKICEPKLELQFGSLDASALQAALLGAHQQGTLLSTLIARLSPSSAPAWPPLQGTVKADTLILGPVTLRNAAVALRVKPTGAEFTSIDAGLLDGQLHATGTLAYDDKPAYTLEGEFEKLSPSAVCQMLGLQCTGGGFSGSGKIELAGFTDKDLASSAKGTVHFEWRKGSILSRTAPPDASLPAALARFDRWTADAGIANETVTIQQNQLQQGFRKSAVEASVSFGEAPKPPAAAHKASEAARR